MVNGSCEGVIRKSASVRLRNLDSCFVIFELNIRLINLSNRNCMNTECVRKVSADTTQQ